MQPQIVITPSERMANPFAQLALELSVVHQWKDGNKVYTIANNESLPMHIIIEILKKRVFLLGPGKVRVLKYSDLAVPNLFTDEGLVQLTGYSTSTIEEMKRREYGTGNKRKELGYEKTMGRKIDILVRLLNGEQHKTIATHFQCKKQAIHTIAIDAKHAGFEISFKRGASGAPKGHNLVMKALFMLKRGDDDIKIALELEVCALKVAKLRTISIEKGFLNKDTA